MGQTYSVGCSAFDGGAAGAFGFKYFSGLARNFVAQPWQQK
jgi:hypothetical protein